MDLLNLRTNETGTAPEQVMGDLNNNNNNNNNKKYKNNNNKKLIGDKLVNNLRKDRIGCLYKCGHRCKLDVFCGDFHVPCSCPYYKEQRSHTFGYEYNFYRRKMRDLACLSEERFNKGIFYNLTDCTDLIRGETLAHFPKQFCLDMKECLPYNVGMIYHSFTLLNQFDMYDYYTRLTMSTVNLSNDREIDADFFLEISTAYYNNKADILFLGPRHSGLNCECPIHFFKLLLIYEIYVEIGVSINDDGVVDSGSNFPIVDTFDKYQQFVTGGLIPRMKRRLLELDVLAHVYSSKWCDSKLPKVETYMLSNFFPTYTTDNVSSFLGQVALNFEDDINNDDLYWSICSSIPVVLGHYIHISFGGALCPPIRNPEPLSPLTTPDSINYVYGTPDIDWLLSEEGPLPPQEKLPEVGFYTNGFSSSEEWTHKCKQARVIPSVEQPLEYRGYNYDFDLLDIEDYRGNALDPLSYSVAMKLMENVELMAPPSSVKMANELRDERDDFELYGLDYLTPDDDDGDIAPPPEIDDDNSSYNPLDVKGPQHTCLGIFAMGRYSNIEGECAGCAFLERTKDVYDNISDFDDLELEGPKEDYSILDEESDSSDEEEGILVTEGRSRVEFNQRQLEKDFKEFIKRMPREDVKLVFQEYKRNHKRIYTALPAVRRIDMQNFLDWLHLHKIDKLKCESNLTTILKAMNLEGLEFIIYILTIAYAFQNKEWMFIMYEFMTNDYWTVQDETISNIVVFLTNAFVGTEGTYAPGFIDTFIVPLLASVGITVQDFCEALFSLCGSRFGDLVNEFPLKENLLLESFLKMVSVVTMSNYLKDLAPVTYLLAFVNKIKFLNVEAFEPMKVVYDFGVTFGQCCVEVYQTRSLMPFLKWDNMEHFIANHSEWINSVKLATKPTLMWFDDRKEYGEELLVRVKKLYKRSQMTSHEYDKYMNSIKSCLYQLENRQKCCSMAPQAFGVILRGPPGGGKSSLADGLHKMIAAMNDMDPSVSVGNVSIDSTHQTGVLSHVITLLFNDVDLAPKGDPKAWIATNEALRAGVDTVAWRTEQASLEDKENAFVKPLLTILTTNSNSWNFAEIPGEKFERRYKLVALVEKVDDKAPNDISNLRIVLEKLVVNTNPSNNGNIGQFKKTGVTLTGQQFLEYFRSKYMEHHNLETMNIAKRNIAFRFCNLGKSYTLHFKDGNREKCCDTCNIDTDHGEKVYGRDRVIQILATSKCISPEIEHDEESCVYCYLNAGLDEKCGNGMYYHDHAIPCDSKKCELSWTDVCYCFSGKHVFDHEKFCDDKCHVFKPNLNCDTGMPWKHHTKECDSEMFNCRYNPERKYLDSWDKRRCNQSLLLTEHTPFPCCKKCNMEEIDDPTFDERLIAYKSDLKTEGFVDDAAVVLAGLFLALVAHIVHYDFKNRQKIYFSRMFLYLSKHVFINDYDVYELKAARKAQDISEYFARIDRARHLEHVPDVSDLNIYFHGGGVFHLDGGGEHFTVEPLSFYVTAEGPRDEEPILLEEQDGVTWVVEPSQRSCTDRCSRRCKCGDWYLIMHFIGSLLSMPVLWGITILWLLNRFLSSTVDRVIARVLPNKLVEFFNTNKGLFLLRLGQGAVTMALFKTAYSYFKRRIPQEKKADCLGCPECDEKCASIRAQHLKQLNGETPGGGQPVSEALRFADNPERFLAYGIPIPDQVRIHNDVEMDKGVLHQPLLLNNSRIATSVLGDVLRVVEASRLEIHTVQGILEGWVFNQSLIVLNTHFLPKMAATKIVPINVKGDKKVLNYEYNPIDITVSLDVAFIKIPGFGNGIEPFLFPAHVKQQSSGKLLCSDGTVIDLVVNLAFKEYADMVYMPQELYRYRVDSESGWCGRLLLLEVGSKWGIAGFHSYGEKYTVPKMGLASPLLSSRSPHVLLKKVEVCIDERVVSEGVLNVKSPLHLIPGAIPLGTYNYAASETPKIMRSDMYDYFKTKLPPGVEYDFPKKKDSGKVDGVWCHGVKKKAKGASYKSFFSTDLMDMIIKHTVDQVNEKAQPTPIGVALVGLEGMVKGMNPSTSNGPGYYHVKNKNELIGPDGQVVSWFETELICRLMDYEEGTMRAWETVFQRKAEVLPLEKIAAYATRIFTVGGLDLNALAKAFMGPLNEIVLRLFSVFRCAGKINATSRQWHYLHKEIMKHLYKLFADESGFDAKHKAAVFHAVATWLKTLALKVGYSDKAADIVYMITMNALNQIVQYKGDFIYMNFMLGSGFFLTLLLNSLVHLFLLWIAYAFIVARDIKRFFDEVCVALVGDDLAGSTSNEEFNLLAIAKVLHDLCGYTLTSSIKGQELTKFSSPEEESFLKRTWRYDTEMDMYMGALYFGSVVKPCMFYEYNKDVSQASKNKDTLNGYQRELFFHGREVFEKYARDPQAILYYEQYNVIQFTYDELKEKFLNDDIYFANWDQTLVLDGRETLNRCTQGVSPNALVTEGIDLQSPFTLTFGSAFSERLPKAAAVLCDNDLTELFNKDVATSADTVVSTSAFNSEFAQSIETAPIVRTIGQYHDETYAAVLAKPIYIGTTAITAVATNYQLSDLYYLWLTNFKIAPLVAKYRQIRCTPKIIVVCNGSSYFLGRAFMGLVPSLRNDPSIGVNNSNEACPLRDVAQLFQLPHVEVDFSKNESFALTCPWLGANDFISTTSSAPTISPGYPSVDFHIMSLNTIACIDPVGVPSPSMTFAIYLAMENIDFNFMETEGKEGRYEGILSMPLKSISEFIQGIPSLPPNFTPYSKIAEGLAGVLSQIGLGKSPIMDTMVVAPVENLNFMTEDGRNVMQTLANQNKQAVIINAPPFASDDDMMIEKICNKWGILTTFAMQSSLPVGTKAATVDVGPWTTNGNVGSSSWYPHPSAFVASFFRFARMDYQIKFEIMGTAFHRGVITFTINTPGAAAVYATTINNVRTYTLDISTEREIIIDIPHQILDPYFCVGDSPSFYSGSATPNSKLNAEINVYVTSPISVGINASAQKIYVNAYIRTLNNEFQQPNPNFWAMSNGLLLEGPEDFVNSATQPLGKYAFGESFSSLKQLTSKLSPYCAFTYSSLADSRYSWTHPNSPLPPTAETVVGNKYPDDFILQLPSTVSCVNGTYSSVIPQCYYATRGGNRWAVDSRSSGTVSTVVPTSNRACEFGYIPKTTEPCSLGTIGDTEQLIQWELSVAGNSVIYSNLSGLNQVIVPDNTPSRFRSANNMLVNYQQASSTDAQMWMCWFFSSLHATGNTDVAVVYHAAADDSVCYMWRFTPHVYEPS